MIYIQARISIPVNHRLPTNQITSLRNKFFFFKRFFFNDFSSCENRPVIWEWREHLKLMRMDYYKNSLLRERQLINPKK